MRIIKVVDLEKKTKEVTEVFDRGGLVIYPTETCYGIGVDAKNQSAVSKLLKYKNRPPGKAISVATADETGVFKLIERNKSNQSIVEKFLPGPITVIGQSKAEVDKRLESELGTLGIRIPAYPPLLLFLSKYGKAVTSTSANISGGAQPYSIKQLLGDLPDSKSGMIDLIIDAGELERNPSSLVIDSTREGQIVRPGLLTETDLQIGESHVSESVEETYAIAKKTIESAYASGDKQILFLLHGELGAGKTQFCAGIGKAMGINQPINSPTFTLAKEYKLRSDSKKGIFHHLDLWRTEEVTTLDDFDIHFENHNKVEKIVCVEWPKRLNISDIQHLKISIIDVKILKLSKNSRRIVITKQQ